MTILGKPVTDNNLSSYLYILNLERLTLSTFARSIASFNENEPLPKLHHPFGQQQKNIGQKDRKI